MNILVTGSDGYIGTHLVQELLKQDHQVVGMDTGFYRTEWFYNGIKQLPLTITKDIRNVTQSDLRNFDAVIHLAELSNDPLGQVRPELTYDINHEGTVRLARLCKKTGIRRFLYSSSCSVYGASDDLSNETSRINPLSIYAKCKVLNERELLRLADRKFSPIIFRNATAYGPSQRMRFDLAVNNLTALAFTEHVAKLESDGTQWRPFVHVLDICKAFICGLNASTSTVRGQIFNVGSNRGNYQLGSLAELIARTIPGCRVIRNSEHIDRRNYRVNFSKISQKLPGYSANRTVQQGIQDLVQVFTKVGLTKEVFQSRHFTRLQQIAYLVETQKINEQFYWNKI